MQRYFTLFGVQPHRSTSFKLSPDPFFIEKVRDIVGLYLNPPDHALVLSVDEKSQIQALERTERGSVFEMLARVTRIRARCEP